MADILVVDDNRYAQLAFVYALKDTPYEVHTADSGQEALIKADAHRFDLIFLDLKMPGMDGVETLRGLSRIQSDVPVYIVTAYREEFMQRLKQAADEGLVFQVATKPLDEQQIRAIVQGMLERPGTG